MRGWLDMIILQGRKLNTFSGSFIQYRDSRSVLPGRIYYLSPLETLNNDAIVWDVTDPFNVKIIPYTRTGDNISFQMLNRFIENIYWLYNGKCRLRS